MSTDNDAPYAIQPGQHWPPGAYPDDNGVNFSILAREAVTAELLLYADGAEEPLQCVALDSRLHRTFFFWHVYVEGARPNLRYTWRVAEPDQDLANAPELLDPWARAVDNRHWNRALAASGEAGHQVLRAIVTERDERDPALRPIRCDLNDAVIYEVHVGGFTRHPSAGVNNPGTFAGLIEKIPYLQQLGVTHVELLPVMAFDEQDVPFNVNDQGLHNYWGYSTCAYFAPHPGYCIDPARAPQEFTDCVRALHEAGIGVLLDVVFNHTAEGGRGGPIINFKALANDVFYHTDPDDRSNYRDYTGCGNTVNCNHPWVTNFIVRCLEYWASSLGVDGFRFDLASVFARDADGNVMAEPLLPWSIELSPVLIGRPLIAEAWDAAGLYQVGSYPGMHWSEWNGRYRDLVRRFVRGDRGLIGELATRLTGSSDLYGPSHRLPSNGVNFVTCHDGFTLHDLVSYNGKHNDANGEENRDGTNDNLSWNCGAEGDTEDADVLVLRQRQARNAFTILLLSQGVPMLLAGDEVLHSQNGNNNAWCQDNELSWFDWTRVESQADMVRFVRELIALRKRHPALRARRFLTGEVQPETGLPDICWHGCELNQPQWNDPDAQLLAFTLAPLQPDEPPLHAVFNMADAVCAAPLPEWPGLRWHRALDTACVSPDDIVPPSEQTPLESDHYEVQPRSVLVLEAR
ncbi:MAG TPA: glycogen debranching protein GlgX [Dongiaceae bacterium]|nr:glycogen debranching protein GlgX [Dongiaceae bacterium]